MIAQAVTSPSGAASLPRDSENSGFGDAPCPRMCPAAPRACREGPSPSAAEEDALGRRACLISN